MPIHCCVVPVGEFLSTERRGVRSLSLTSLSVPPKDPNGVRLAAQMKMPRFSMMERGVEDLVDRWSCKRWTGHKVEMRWVVENTSRANCVCVCVWCESGGVVLVGVN